ncbi:hypothetical protein CNY89_24895, partial [Amaricoccus sp. HAR-UPW-R2A-40]
PLDRFREPKLGLDLAPRSGPVAITVEYRIRETDVPEFLGAMADRQRMRQRDGARLWTLMRDLEDPEIWVEFYQTATWIDYLRHHERSTRADATQAMIFAWMPWIFMFMMGGFASGLVVYWIAN